MHLVARFNDESIYALGDVNWAVNFYATRANPQSLWPDTLGAGTAVTAGATVITNRDPRKLSWPSTNTTTDWH